jgi:hypothetical protein
MNKGQRLLLMFLMLDDDDEDMATVEGRKESKLAIFFSCRTVVYLKAPPFVPFADFSLSLSS